jgi:hypothetical protein
MRGFNGVDGKQEPWDELQRQGRIDLNVQYQIVGVPMPGVVSSGNIQSNREAKVGSW